MTDIILTNEFYTILAYKEATGSMTRGTAPSSQLARGPLSCPCSS
jgi:hypothetical protein